MSMSRIVPARRVATLFALALFSAAGSAAAQPWEMVYGPTASVDEGNRRVAPALYCAGGGFIAVGTSTPTTGTNSNVYVIRTAANGFPIWELQYDIGPGSIDRGESLAQLTDGSGFVVAGITRSSTGDDAFLMKINCGGGIVWLNVYGTALDEGAFDVVQATTGDAAFGTAPGDLVAVGYAVTSTGKDAMIFRTRSSGALLWNRRYDVGGTKEEFRALTETRPTTSPAGDIVAVGSLIGTNEQAYAVRVSGNNGLIGAVPQCAVIIGGPDQERFDSVVELRHSAALPSQLVMAGSSTAAAYSSDIFLVRTASNPCTVLAQRRTGDPAAGPYGEELAFDVREVSAALPIASVGQLALTGRVGRALTTTLDDDAFLLIADPTVLAPIGGTGRLYGDHAGRRESGMSIHPLTTGFVIAGLSESDPQAVGDARDVYLVQADGNGKTSCEIPWNPPHVTAAFPVMPLTPLPVSFLARSPRTASIIQQATPYQACP